jgi:hypothetical protein
LLVWSFGYGGILRVTHPSRTFSHLSDDGNRLEDAVGSICETVSPLRPSFECAQVKLRCTKEKLLCEIEPLQMPGDSHYGG